MTSISDTANLPQGLDIESDYVREIAGFKTQFDVFRFLKRITETFGTRAFMVTNIPATTSQALSPNSVITNWPAELLNIYDQQRFLASSPLVQQLRDSTRPVEFELNRTTGSRNEQVSAAIKGLFERFKMVRGGCFPVHDAAGTRGAVSFLGDRDPFSRQEMLELLYISVHVFDRLAEIRSLDVRVVDTLTEREIDCLNWTAAGKTSAEIAEILTLSEHTVNHYLNRATKKLDTVNRTQAVAKALRVGLIK
jgi:DNA-binding CsgD family transcriptional regulator